MSDTILKALHELLLDYGLQLKVVEAEIVRRARRGETVESLGKIIGKAKFLKELQKECVMKMANFGNKKN